MTEEPSVDTPDEDTEPTEEAEQVDVEEQPSASVEVVLDPLEEALARAEHAEREIAYKEADLQNARKRFAQERADLARYGAQHLARRMTGVLVDVDRALSNLPDDAEGPVLEGLQMLRERLASELTSANVTRISAKGQSFDPATMEAITTVPASDEHPTGQVVDELEPGFMLHDRVLSPARVVVAS